MQISDKGCSLMDKANCDFCSQGYKHFRGRCHVVQEECLLYDPEECFLCKDGYKLEKGGCVKDDWIKCIIYK